MLRSNTKVSWYKQLDAMDCGPSCLRMVSAHYGKQYSLQYLRERSYITRASWGYSRPGVLGVLVMVFVSGYLIPYNEYYETACEYNQNKENEEAGYIHSVIPAWDTLRIQIGQKAELTFRGVPGTDDLILKGSISSITEDNPDDKVNIQYQIDGSFSADSLAGRSKSGEVKILIKEAHCIE